MKKNEKTASISSILAISATFIGTVVGAGFASGQEIYQFFSRYGLNGFWGLFIATLLLGWLGGKIFKIGHFIQPNSYHDFFVYILGKNLAGVVDLLLFGFLVVLIGVMFAGSGTVFESLKLGYWQGIFCTGVLLTIVLLFKLTGLITANLIIVPLMFLGSLSVSIHAIMTQCSPMITSPSQLNWLLASFQFASYNLLLATPVLLSLAKEFPSIAKLKSGSWVGSIGLGIIAGLIHWSLLCHLPHLHQNPIPMIELAKLIGVYPYCGYAVILWGEMFSTLLANTYGVTQRLSSFTGWSYRVSLIMVTVTGIIISQVGFVNLIAKGYPLFGFLALVIMFYLFIK